MSDCQRGCTVFGMYRPRNDAPRTRWHGGHVPDVKQRHAAARKTTTDGNTHDLVQILYYIHILISISYITNITVPQGWPSMLISMGTKQSIQSSNASCLIFRETLTTDYPHYAVTVSRLTEILVVDRVLSGDGPPE